MKLIILVLPSLMFVSSALAFRGGGGGFRGGGVSVGVGFGSGGVSAVSVGGGVAGPRGSVSAHRSAAMGAHYHPYTTSYWGWYGYAPYHYYYPTTTYTEVIVHDETPALKGSVVNDVPKNCKSETIKDVSYKHCGVNWFEPQFYGTEIEYKVVDDPMGKQKP